MTDSPSLPDRSVDGHLVAGLAGDLVAGLLWDLLALFSL